MMIILTGSPCRRHGAHRETVTVNGALLNAFFLTRMTRLRRRRRLDCSARLKDVRSDMAISLMLSSPRLALLLKSIRKAMSSDLRGRSGPLRVRIRSPASRLIP